MPHTLLHTPMAPTLSEASPPPAGTPPMSPSHAPEPLSPMPDTHTPPTTTARDPLMLNQRPMLMLTTDIMDMD